MPFPGKSTTPVRPSRFGSETRSKAVDHAIEDMRIADGCEDTGPPLDNLGETSAGFKEHGVSLTEGGTDGSCGKAMGNPLWDGMGKSRFALLRW